MRIPLGLALLLAALGCDTAEPFPHLHPLSGTVARGGRPVDGGGLILLPDTPARTGLVVDAAVRPDGTFEAKTSRTTGAGTESRPGAPAGTYRAVYHPPGDGSKMNREVEIPGRVTVGCRPATASLVLPDGSPGEPPAAGGGTPALDVSAGKLP